MIPADDNGDLEWSHLDPRPLATVTPIAGRQQPRVYLAGPMRGRERYNFDAFDAAAVFLRELDYDVISPAEHDLSEGFDPSLPLEDQGFDLKVMLGWDLEQVLNADAVITLPGWQHSLGALAEVATARAVGVPVLEYAEILDGTAVAA